MENQSASITIWLSASGADMAIATAPGREAEEAMGGYVTGEMAARMWGQT